MGKDVSASDSSQSRADYELRAKVRGWHGREWAEMHVSVVEVGSSILPERFAGGQLQGDTGRLPDRCRRCPDHIMGGLAFCDSRLQIPDIGGMKRSSDVLDPFDISRHPSAWT